jgi:phosphate transport system substrate-binding protein
MKTSCESVLLVTGVLLTLLLGSLCAKADEKAIRVYGATTFSELIENSAKAFTKERPDIRVDVLGKSSEFGFLALMNREADLVMAARKPNAVERRLAEKKGVKWTGVRVAWENVAVICNPDVTLRELTVDQLRKIYTGDYKNWRDLGGPDLAILPHSLSYPQDDVALWFADKILSKAEFVSAMISVKAPDFLVEHVSVHAGSIAYLGNLQLTDILKRLPQLKVRILSIRENDHSPALSPSAEIWQKGDYPLVIPLFLFRNENNPDKRIEQFAKFCTERLQKPVEK